MANSSSWIEQVGSERPGQPAWVAALDARDGFEPGVPFAEAPLDPPQEVAPGPVAVAADEDAVARAFADGEAAGRAAAEVMAEAEIARLRDLRLTFRSFDQAALDTLASELCDTVVGLCEQVLEASAINRDGLIERCHWAARRLGGASGQMTLRLHPEDIELVGSESLADWNVQADPAAERGSLMLEGPDGAMRDGPAEWRRAIAEAVRG